MSRAGGRDDQRERDTINVIKWHTWDLSAAGYEKLKSEFGLADRKQDEKICLGCMYEWATTIKAAR